MTKMTASPLRMTAYAWAKLLALRDFGPTEVGAFGISAAGDLLLIEDVCLVRQRCTEVTVKFDDNSVADYFDQQVDTGLPPERFGRIWIHTHPGNSAEPSNTDEETFARCFGSADWAVMFILARGGRTYARLRFRAGPGGQIELPVEVDFAYPFQASAADAWKQEYERSVAAEVWAVEKPAGRPIHYPPDLWDGLESQLADPFFAEAYANDPFYSGLLPDDYPYDILPEPHNVPF